MTRHASLAMTMVALLSLCALNTGHAFPTAPLATQTETSTNDTNIHVAASSNRLVEHSDAMRGSSNTRSHLDSLHDAIESIFGNDASSSASHVTSLNDTFTLNDNSLSVYAIYIPGWKSLPSSYLLPSRLDHVTHLIFTFMDLNTSNGSVFFDPIGVNMTFLDDLATIRTAFPNIQIGVSLGGWSYKDHFREAWAPLSQQKRAINITNINCTADSLIPYFQASDSRSYYFDFLDIDWEYPIDTIDDTALGLFFARMNDNFQTFQLSNAYMTYALAPNYISREFPRVTTFQDNIKYFFVMEYDYAGTWLSTSELDAPVKTTNENMMAMISKGLDANKLVYGITGNTKSFQGTNGLHAPYRSMLTGTDSASSPSNLPNYCDATQYAHMMDDTDTNSQYIYDPEQQTLTTLETPLTLALKFDFANINQLAGFFFWDASIDCPAQSTNSLLDYIAAQISVDNSNLTVDQNQSSMNMHAIETVMSNIRAALGSTVSVLGSGPSPHILGLPNEAIISI